MSPVGEVVGAWSMMSSGVVGLILLFLLSIFLTALCSDCVQRSFELQNCPDVEIHPPALIRVVKLEDAMVGRENPMMHQIQNDEKEGKPAKLDPDEENCYKPWRSHLGALEQGAAQSSNGTQMQDGSPPGDTAVERSRSAELEEENWYKPWRSHLGALRQDAEPEPRSVHGVDDLTYAHVSQKIKHLTPSPDTPPGRLTPPPGCLTPPPEYLTPPPGRLTPPPGYLTPPPGHLTLPAGAESSSPPLPGRMELEG